MSQPDRNPLKWPPFSPRVHPDRHRCTRTQGGEQEVVARWPCVCTSSAFRVIAPQPMWTYSNLRCDSPCLTPDDVCRFNSFPEHRSPRVRCSLSSSWFPQPTDWTTTVTKTRPARGLPSAQQKACAAPHELRTGYVARVRRPAQSVATGEYDNVSLPHQRGPSGPPLV